MKKILSVALSTAMAFSMFASVAFGETATTPQQKFDALAAKGILNGYPDGQAHLEKDLTRGEFAKIVTKLFDLTEVKNKLSYKDKGYNANNWAVPYIEAVTAANLMQGKDTVKGIFDYNGKVTVEEVAAVLFRALKLETPATTDNNASVWAKGYVQAVINKGLMAQNVNFKGNATRSLVVEAAYAVETMSTAPVVASAEALSPTSVLVTFADKTTTTVTLTTPLVEGTETTVPFQYKGFNLTAKVTLAAPKVVSVTAPNSKQLVVKYNRAINSATVKESGGTAVDNVFSLVPLSGAQPISIDTADVAVSEDGTLTFTFGADSFLKGQYTFTSTKAVKTTTGTEVAPFTTLLTVADTTAPTIVSVTATARTTTNTVSVKLSEPVKATGVIAYVNGVPAQATRPANTPIDELVITTTGSLESGKSYEVSLLNVADYASNYITPNPYTTQVAVVADANAPKISSLTVTGERSAKVVFDKNIDAKSLDGNIYLLNGTGERVGTFTVTAVDAKTYTITMASLNIPASNVFNGTIVFGATIKDYLGNALGTPVSQAISFNKDVVAPTVASATYGSTGLVLKFSEAVNVNTGTLVLINDATGAATNITVTGTANSDKTQLTFGQKVNPGSYTLRVPAGFVRDEAAPNPNVNAAVNLPVTVAATSTTDNEKPKIKPDTRITSNTDGQSRGNDQLINFTLTDNIGINVGTILNINNYTLDGKALPAGSYVTTSGFENGTTPSSVDVTIHIPAGGIATTSKVEEGKGYIFVVNGVTDTAGNVITPASEKVTLIDSVRPTLATAVISAGDATTLVVGFSENVTGVQTNNNLTFTINDKDVTGAATISAPQAAGTDKGKYYVTFSTLVVDGKVYADIDKNGQFNNQVDVLISESAGNAASGMLNLNAGFVNSVKVTVTPNSTNPTFTNSIKDAEQNSVVTGGTVTVK